MFDLIGERKRPAVKWWTIPAAVCIVFCCGVDTGILIDRRDTDPSDWLKVAFLILISVGTLWPIGRELTIHRTRGGENDGE